MSVLPTYEDLVKAAQRLDGNAIKTKLIRSDIIDDMTGKTVWFKPECSQKVRAFKYRGAFNRLCVMSAAERAKGVVAYSSGNHAQGVSRSAKELRISAIIIMPDDAPAVKVAGVRNDGAEIIFYDRASETREDIAQTIHEEQGRIIVPSYDDPYIMAGQGTVGLEVAQSGTDFDALITCLGGGGLCAGISVAMNKLSPSTKIFGAEPEDYNDHQRSLKSGRRTPLTDFPPTLCDALMTPQPGELTWQINQKSLSGVFDVSDTACLFAMALAKREFGVQLEPGGAVAMAAVMEGAFSDDHSIETICVVLTGGNVDPEIAQRADALIKL